ncbi:MAG: thrombospondin type 3 repeat-containing protein, partial [Phycisphaerae bacterium]
MDHRSSTRGIRLALVALLCSALLVGVTTLIGGSTAASARAAALSDKISPASHATPLDGQQARGGLGACCVPGGCIDGIDAITCAQIGGSYQGAGSFCPAGCLIGGTEACCLLAGGCIDEDPFVCSTNGDTPLGPGTTCNTDGFLCAGGGTEACCIPGGGCLDLEPLNECPANGGFPQGPGTDCLSAICTSGPTEACCFPGGGCSDDDPAVCSSQGGIPQGPGTDCLTAICTNGPTEACCFPGGGCSDDDPAVCSSQGGTPQGPGTDCLTAVCATGACCLPPVVGPCGIILPDPNCIITTQADCLIRGGNYLGDNSECETLVMNVIHTATQWTHEFVPVSNCPTFPRGVAGCVPGPGHIDPWVTAAGLNNCEDFSAPGACPIPADFFGPGSDPFSGQICFRGDPLGIIDIPGFGPLNYGDADTLVLRSADPFARCDVSAPFPQPSAPVAIELVALNLVSCAPVDITSNGGQNPVQWDVRVIVNGPQPPSSLTATKTHCNGGTFDSALAVCPQFVFTRVSNPLDVRVLDFCLDCDPNGIQMATAGVDWVHDVGPNTGLVSPVCSDFHPGIADANPTTVCDCNSNGVRDDCEPDSDGDGLIDDCDNCLNDSNLDQLDTDGNGDGDACDPDDDGDGVPDDGDNSGVEGDNPCTGGN